MFRRFLTAALAVLLLNLAAPARAAQKTADDPALKVMNKVLRLGAGASVEVKLRDGRKLKGKLGEADEDAFMVVDSKGGRTRVTYESVKSLKRQGEFGTSSDIKMALIGVGMIGGIILLGVFAASQTR
jgi:small nuclear ribonucleoprotein (snRNP)-like protein